jgi:alpha-amylase
MSPLPSKLVSHLPVFVTTRLLRRRSIERPNRNRFGLTAMTLTLALGFAGAGLTSLSAAPRLPSADPRPTDEVFYQIFVRSFRDSDGDAKGDLQGIEEELGYLQDLGVTTVLLTPLYLSPFYHSYFADDFTRVDPAYGTEASLRHLVRAIHQRGMQIFLDEEMQYVTGQHEWFRDSYGSPGSKYSGYLIYKGPGNTLPETGFWGNPEVQTYDGKIVLIATVNLHEPAVQAYEAGLFARWMTPTAPGADDGVDGFRIDHMQDNLDDHGLLMNLFSNFWAPLFQKLKSVKPELRILAEQADWGFGDPWLGHGLADMVFAFPIRQAILSFDKAQLTRATTETWQKTPSGKQPLIFIENHDTDRFASEVGGDVRKEKVGAALSLLLKGIPLIYYGQEVGMTGNQLKDSSSDGGDIPRRQAFPWTTRIGPGTAVWYKDSGPWWKQSALAMGGGVSLEEEKGRPDSLFAYYRTLLAFRRAHPELISGTQLLVDNDSSQVFSFVRCAGARRTLVAVNLADTPVTVQLNPGDPAGDANPDPWSNQLSSAQQTKMEKGRVEITLPAYGVGVYSNSPGN